MNIKWIIIGVIGLIIFIAMGKNPFDPPKDYVYEDPVKKSLRERASGTGPSNSFWGSAPNSPATGGFNFPTTTQPNLAPINPTPPKPAPTPANPEQPSPFQNLPTAPSTEPLPPGASMVSPPYVPKFALASGAPVRFSGAFAYTLDDYGNTVRLKDGDHTMTNGLTITIKEGRVKWKPLKWGNEEKRT